MTINLFFGGIFMKKLLVVVVALETLILVGCTTVAPITATSNPLGSKVGEAKGTYLFGFDSSCSIYCLLCYNIICNKER